MTPDRCKYVGGTYLIKVAFFLFFPSGKMIAYSVNGIGKTVILAKRGPFCVGRQKRSYKRKYKFSHIKLLNSQQQNTLGTVTLGRENYSK